MPKAAKHRQPKHPPKTKKKPAGMTGRQKDAVQDIHDKKLASVPQALKDGKIDHGDAADPNRGVLDPKAFDDFSHEYRAVGSETKRIEKVICEHLNEYHNPNGEYQWTCGFFLENDPRSQGSAGHQVLTEKALGPAWSTQLRRELGLTVYEGALCWNGRGMHERHIICVKTKQLQQRQLDAAAEAAESMVKQPEGVGPAGSGRLEVTEKVRKLPLVPGDGISKKEAQVDIE